MTAGGTAGRPLVSIVIPVLRDSVELDGLLTDLADAADADAALGTIPGGQAVPAGSRVAPPAAREAQDLVRDVEQVA